VPIRREAFDVVLFVFSDTRELIAAGKVQRWDVLKWTVTVNIGLAAQPRLLGNHIQIAGGLSLSALSQRGLLDLG
jgi:hypothetical protein